MRVPIYRAGIVSDPARASEILINEWFTTKVVDGKIVVCAALGSVPDVEVIKSKILPFNFNTSPRDNNMADMHFLGTRLAINSAARDLQWQYMKDNWDTCLDKLSNPIVLDRFIRCILSSFVEESDVEDISTFFADKDTSSYNRTLETAKGKSGARAAYKKRDGAAIKEWLAANGY